MSSFQTAQGHAFHKLFYATGVVTEIRNVVRHFTLRICFCFLSCSRAASRSGITKPSLTDGDGGLEMWAEQSAHCRSKG